ncbi:MAG: histidine kinase [Crocinitomicaceae bacterium]|nr:histidine kinase [Flavobacteriales bacterium]NQZ35246.1 histidine kinase [Crocinitomicaceae bacterium]
MRTIFLLIICFGSLFSFGQNDFAQQEKEFENNFVRHYQSDYDSAQYWCNRSIQLLENEVNSPKRLSFRYGDKASIFRKQGMLDSALLYGWKSLNLASKTPDADIAMSHHSLSTIHFSIGNYDSSIYYGFKELDVLRKLNRDERIALSIINASYSDMGDYKNALLYSRKIIKLSTNNDTLTRRDSVYIANGFSQLGNCYYELKKFDKTIKYHTQAYKINIALKRSESIIIAAYNLTNIYSDKESGFYNSDSTEHYLNEIWRNSQEVKSSYGILLSRFMKGIQCAKNGNLNSAIYYLTIAEKHMNQHKQFKKSNDIYKHLAISYASINSDSSMHYIALYDSVMHSRFSESKAEAIKDIEVKYETQKVLRNNNQLQEEIALNQRVARLRTYFFIGISLLLILIAGFIILYLKRKREKAEMNMLKAEQTLLRTQMNPHFIFNSLSTIGSYILSNEIEDGYIYISKFSKLMRHILDSSRQETIDLQQEIDLMDNFLWLHKMRLKDKLNYEIKIDPTISLEEIEIPPMLLQPHIENSIIHGIEAFEEKGFILIEIKNSSDGLLMQITDSGPGFNLQDLQKKKEHRSHAIQITQERIENIKRSKKLNINLSILNQQHDDQGTTVSLKFIHKN